MVLVLQILRDKYFQEFFWDYLKGQENTEYISFKENVDF
jgi:hypothetical protein